jgi:hypothetical protein
MIALTLHALHHLTSARIYAYAIDHVEPKLEESMKQAQAEDLTNLALDQGKPWCI